MIEPGIDIPWKVYGLVDPRTRRVFYVGCSYLVHDRVLNHRTLKKSSTYDRCREIEADGYSVEYCIFGSFHDQGTACVLEEALIIAIPGILNRTNREDRRRYWQYHPEALATIVAHDASKAARRQKEAKQ